MESQVTQTPSKQGAADFIRDRRIWIYYALVGLNCYAMSALGPLMPFLRAELDLDYKVAGLHFSAFAMGTILAGTIGDWVVKKLGRVTTLGATTAGTIIGALLLVAAPSFLVSIPGVLLCGFCTSVSYQTLASIVSDHLNELRTIAYMEAEVVAMVVAGIAPFAVSASVSTGLGWRAAMILMVVLLLCTVPSLKSYKSIKETVVENRSASGKLPKSYWGYGTVILLSVAAEWSTAFWSADYLHQRVGMSKAAAAAAVGVFFIGMVLGRFAGSRLIRRYEAHTLLVASGIVSLIGFAMFWLGTIAPVSVFGLFATGLGIASMYPLSFANAVAATPSMRSTAIARISLICGSSILVVPLLLSLVADKSGLFTAYSLIAGALVLCFASMFVAKKLQSDEAIKSLQSDCAESDMCKAAA